MHEFLRVWREFPSIVPPHALSRLESDHALDLLGDAICNYRDFTSYANSPDFGEIGQGVLHLGLRPQPFVGDLNKAKIFLLMGNPGFSHCDYFGEEMDRRFRAALSRTTRQEFAKSDYPMLFLNPQFSYHPGSAYWLKKLGSIIEVMPGPYRDRLAVLSELIAVIDLIPYHSQGMGFRGKAKKIVANLPSSDLARGYVRAELLPRAKDGKIGIVWLRGDWKLPPTANLVVYEGAHKQSAHLTPTSPGGKLILQMLQLNQDSKDQCDYMYKFSV